MKSRTQRIATHNIYIFIKRTHIRIGKMNIEKGSVENPSSPIISNK